MQFCAYGTHTHTDSVVNCACCTDRGGMIESRVSNTLCIEMSVNDFRLRQWQRTKCNEIELHATKIGVFNVECTIIMVVVEKNKKRNAHALQERNRKRREERNTRAKILSTNTIICLFEFITFAQRHWFS